MTHLVLLKFEPGYLTEEHFAEIVQAFHELKAALPNHIAGVQIHKNEIVRDSNMDIMIELELLLADSLSSYLNHPIHLKLGEKMNPHTINRVSFDYTQGGING